MDYCTAGHCTFNRQFVGGSGDPNAPFAILGEAPGRVELRRGEPFVGPAGELLTTLLGMAGIERSECYLLNTVCCVDLDRKPPTPTVAEIEYCHMRLVEDLAQWTGKLIICMGATAQSQFLPGMTITAARGKLRRMALYEKDYTVMSTYHPSAVLRGSTQYRDLIVEDLTTARRYVG